MQVNIPCIRHVGHNQYLLPCDFEDSGVLYRSSFRIGKYESSLATIIAPPRTHRVAVVKKKHVDTTIVSKTPLREVQEFNRNNPSTLGYLHPALQPQRICLDFNSTHLPTYDAITH